MRSRPLFRFTSVIMAAGALLLSSGSIARQDATSLLEGVSSGRGAHGRLAFVPALSSPADVEDLLRERNASWLEPEPFGAGGFVVAEQRAGAELPEALEADAPPFMDRTLRGDRLAPPVQSHDAVTADASSESSPPAEESGSTGPDLRHGSTPAYAVGETSTPSFGDAPVAVAALPVMTAEERRRLLVAVRFTPAADAVQGGVTEAERRVDAAGRPITRLAHSVLIPEAELGKQQQCLAEAIYFEARGEPERGQYGVAQVVMNRTRTGFYPSTICKVVYQNRHRYNACQFSFACDRFPDRIYNRPAWALAQRIARDVTENGAWLDDVGGATHYHANYVRPYWRRSMIKESTIGRHIFYRARSLPHLGPPSAVSDAGIGARRGEAS